jgi:hypothetical protein
MKKVSGKRISIKRRFLVFSIAFFWLSQSPEAFLFPFHDADSPKKQRTRINQPA